MKPSWKDPVFNPLSPRRLSYDMFEFYDNLQTLVGQTLAKDGCALLLPCEGIKTVVGDEYWDGLKWISEAGTEIKPHSAIFRRKVPSLMQATKSLETLIIAAFTPTIVTLGPLQSMEQVWGRVFTEARRLVQYRPQDYDEEIIKLFRGQTPERWHPIWSRAREIIQNLVAAHANQDSESPTVILQGLRENLEQVKKICATAERINLASDQVINRVVQIHNFLEEST